MVNDVPGQLLPLFLLTLMESFELLCGKVEDQVELGSRSHGRGVKGSRAFGEFEGHVGESGDGFALGTREVEDGTLAVQRAAKRYTRIDLQLGPHVACEGDDVLQNPH